MVAFVAQSVDNWTILYRLSRIRLSRSLFSRASGENAIDCVMGGLIAQAVVLCVG